MSQRSLFFDTNQPFEDRLELVLSTVKSLSSTSVPAKMVEVFGEEVGDVLKRDATISLTRRHVPAPKFQISRFEEDLLPEIVWTGNLFGRAVHNLRVGEELKKAHEIIDNEVKVVAEIQNWLLPEELPEIPGMELAVHYNAAQRAGGDYYDFFKLPSGKWGILIADVSGHGPSAAVLMAITHALAHTNPEINDDPAVMLNSINNHLILTYTKKRNRLLRRFTQSMIRPLTRCVMPARDMTHRLCRIQPTVPLRFLRLRITSRWECARLRYTNRASFSLCRAISSYCSQTVFSKCITKTMNSAAWSVLLKRFANVRKRRRPSSIRCLTIFRPSLTTSPPTMIRPC